jgi:hypothetical protein
MSAATKGRFSLGLTVETGVNDVIIINDGSDRTCTIAAGRYFVTGDGSSSDLLKAVEDALNNSASALTFTVALVANAGSTRGQTLTTGSGSFYYKWASGSSTFYRLALGYSAATNTANATTQTSPYSSACVWYPEREGIVSLSETENVITWQESLSGAVDSHKIATRTHYTATYEPVDRTLVNVADIGLAGVLDHPPFETFWGVVTGTPLSATGPGGGDFWWTPDVDSTTGYRVVIRDKSWNETLANAATEVRGMNVQMYRVSFPMRAYVTLTA